MIVKCSLCDSTMSHSSSSLNPDASSLSPPNRYSDLTHAPDLETSNEKFHTFRKVCEACQTRWEDEFGEITEDPIDDLIDDIFLNNTNNEPTDQAFRYGFNEPMNDIVQSSTYYASINQNLQDDSNSSSKISNRNTKNQKRAVSDLEEVSSNEGSLPKKPKSSSEGSVSVFQTFPVSPPKKEKEFKIKLREFLNAHAEDGEGKKDQNLYELRQMAQTYGEHIHNINETHIQDIFIMRACIHGIYHKSYDETGGYREISYLNIAMTFGVELPDPEKYQTETEKNNLVQYIKVLRNQLQSKLHSIIITGEEQNTDLISKTQTTIGCLTELEKKILSQIKIITSSSSRAQIFSRLLRELKEKLNACGIDVRPNETDVRPKSRQPQAQSLAELFLLIPDDLRSWGGAYPSDYLFLLEKDHSMFIFQSDNKKQDEKLYQQFFKDLLAKEERLRRAARMPEDQIDIIIKAMTRRLQITSIEEETSSQRNTQPIDNEFQEVVNEWRPTESPSSSVPPSPSPAPSLFRSKTMPPPSPPDIPYVSSSIGDEPMNDDTLINDSSLPLTPDNPYVPSPPNGYSDLTHFPDLEMDNEHFYTFPKVCEAYQTDRNELVETTESFIDDTFLNNTNNEPTDQASQYEFNESMTYWEPSQSYSSPSFSLSNMPVMVSSGIPQTPAASSGLNRNTNNQERAASDLEEVPSNEGSLPKKPKHSPEGSVSAFQVFGTGIVTKEKNEFKEKLREFLDQHANDTEDKKDQNLCDLRQMAEKYGKNIHNITETHVQDILIIQACVHGIDKCSSDDGRGGYREIRHLDIAMRFGVKLPHPQKYQTEIEKNNLHGYLILLRKKLRKKLHSITPIDENPYIRLINTTWKTINNLIALEKETSSGITIQTSSSRRAEIFTPPLRRLKKKLTQCGIDVPLKEKQPQAQSLAELLLLIPPDNCHSFVEDHPSDYLNKLEEQQMFIFQSDDKERDEKLHKKFFEPLLAKEEELRKASGMPPEKIKPIITEMTRQLQTTPIEEETSSQTRIQTGPSQRRGMSFRQLDSLKDKLTKLGCCPLLEKGQPLAKSLALLLLAIPDHTFGVYPSDFLQGLADKEMFIFQGHHRKKNEALRKEFFEPLLAKEEELRKASGMPPEQIKPIITEMTRLLQTTPIEEKTSSQTPIQVSSSAKTSVLVRQINSLKKTLENLGISSWVEENQPLAKSLSQLLIRIPSHAAGVYPSDCFNKLESKELYIFQGKNQKKNEALREEFFEDLLAQERKLREDAGMPPEEIDLIIQNMTRQLQTTPTFE